MKKNYSITICSSINFYKDAIKIKGILEERGHKVLVPTTAERMKNDNNFDVATYKPTLDEFKRKASLMRGHFEAVEASDTCLVINNEKHGQPNYIGGNVLMEMGVAFHLKKPIFILNEIPEELPYLEEIIGVLPIVLHGDLNNLPKGING